MTWRGSSPAILATRSRPMPSSSTPWNTPRGPKKRAQARARGRGRASAYSRHVTGRELCEGARRLALEHYGLMAMTVLALWGIRSTSDIGEIVFNLIASGDLEKTPDDDSRPTSTTSSTSKPRSAATTSWRWTRSPRSGSRGIRDGCSSPAVRSRPARLRRLGRGPRRAGRPVGIPPGRPHRGRATLIRIPGISCTLSIDLKSEISNLRSVQSAQKIWNAYEDATMARPLDSPEGPNRRCFGRGPRRDAMSPS